MPLVSEATREKLAFKLDCLAGTLRFFSYHDNLHALPGVEKLLCWLGRHDYEVRETLGQNHALLECVYCPHKKRSKFVS